jgi:hypothetical protein
MGQFFTDDIDALLKSGHGDSTRLAKIKADFEATKLVSIDDRRYVEGLVARYLQPADLPKPEKTVSESPKRIVPPPPPPRNPPTLLEVKQKPKKEEKIPRIESKTKLRNVVIAVCATVFAVLAVSFVAMNQDQGIVTVQPTAKALELDSTAYARGDIISISGKTKVATQTARLAITNPGGSEIWNETVMVKPDGTFSTLAIAGGEGWEQAGTYVVSLTYSGNSETTSFSFSPSNQD